MTENRVNYLQSVAKNCKQALAFAGHLVLATGILIFQKVLKSPEQQPDCPSHLVVPFVPRMGDATIDVPLAQGRDAHGL